MFALLLYQPKPGARDSYYLLHNDRESAAERVRMILVSRQPGFTNAQRNPLRTI